MCQFPEDDLKTQADYFAVLRQFTLFSQHNAKMAGLSTEQYQCLLAIKGFDHHDAPTIDQLMPLLFLERTAVLELIEQLVTAELIGITENSNVTMAMSFQLTNRGEIVLAEIAKKDEIGLKRLQLRLLASN